MGEADTINKRCPRTASTAGGVANTRGGVLTMSNVTCRVDDCDARVKARGLCPTHYSRWRRNGTLWPAHADALVVDHVDHDRSNNDRDNLVPSCQRCNANRGSI